MAVYVADMNCDVSFRSVADWAVRCSLLLSLCRAQRTQGQECLKGFEVSVLGGCVGTGAGAAVVGSLCDCGVRAQEGRVLLF